MKRTILIAVCLSVFTSLAAAQMPYVAVYFDKEYRSMIRDCPPEPVGTVFDSIYVVANNFNMWMNAIEYSIEYPYLVVWVGDRIGNNVLSLGNSPSGITLAYTLPANAFDPLLLQKAYIIWMCTEVECGCGGYTAFLRPAAHPGSGQLRAVRWPDLLVVPALAYWSVICPCMSPAEETTWGRIKALYQ